MGLGFSVGLDESVVGSGFGREVKEYYGIVKSIFVEILYAFSYGS